MNEYTSITAILNWEYQILCDRYKLNETGYIIECNKNDDFSFNLLDNNKASEKIGLSLIIITKDKIKFI